MKYALYRSFLSPGRESLTAIEHFYDNHSNLQHGWACMHKYIWLVAEDKNGEVSITRTIVQYNLLVHKSFKKTKFPDLFCDAISQTYGF